MKPFFCRIGSKARITKKLLPLIPEHETYVEPFAGSLALLWAKEKSKNEVVNDFDPEMMNAYKVLKAVPEDSKFQEFKNLEEVNHFYLNAPDTIENLLLKYIMKHCGGFGGVPRGKIYKIPSKKQKLDKLSVYKNRFKDVVLYNESYETVILKHDSPTTFFYFDPPYEHSTKDVRDYRDINLIKFRDLLKTLKGKWLVSLNDSPFIRELFKGFIIEEIIVPACSGKTSKSNVGNKNRNEVLIMNYCNEIL